MNHENKVKANEHFTEGNFTTKGSCIQGMKHPNLLTSEILWFIKKADFIYLIICSSNTYRFSKEPESIHLNVILALVNGDTIQINTIKKNGGKIFTLSIEVSGIPSEYNEN